MKKISKKIVLSVIAILFFSFSYSQKLETFSKSANGDFYRIFKVSKNMINPVSDDFITIDVKQVYKKSGKDTVTLNTKGEPLTIQLKTFMPSSSDFESLSKMSPGDSCLLLSRSDSIKDIYSWVDMHSFITTHIHLLTVESPEAMKTRKEEEIRKSILQCSFNIPQLLSENSQCPQKFPRCTNGTVGGVNEYVLPEIFEQFKKISTQIQFITAESQGFTSIFGLPCSGANIFNYGEDPGHSTPPPDGVIYIFVGLCKIYPCEEKLGSEIVINSKEGEGLYFKLTKEKGLIYIQGKGSVSIDNVVTKLPIVIKSK
jgi:hypothetical protein